METQMERGRERKYAQGPNRVIKWRKMVSHVVAKSVISIQRNVAFPSSALHLLRRLLLLPCIWIYYYIFRLQIHIRDLE